MKVLQHFVLGMQFLTRIPITKKSVPCEPRDFKGALSFFCFIGLIIGVIQYLTFVTSAKLLNIEMATILTYIMGVWVTGGLHLDGLADLGDAFGANASPEKSLEIMKDSRVGSFGVIAIIIDLLVHVVGIYSLRDTMHLYILVPVGAKFSVCLLCFIGKNISKGMGSLWITNIAWLQLMINLLLFIGVMAISRMSIVNSILGIVIICFSTYIFNRWCIKRLRGINGDCLGAMSQISEWILLMYFITLI